MPKLRANPSLTGGQIRLRQRRRVAETKWIGVFSIMVLATVIEGGLPVADFRRAGLDMALQGVRASAVYIAAGTAQADVIDLKTFGSAGPSRDVPTIASDHAAPDNDASDIENSDFVSRYSFAAAGLMNKASLKSPVCPWSRTPSNS